MLLRFFRDDLNTHCGVTLILPHESIFSMESLYIIFWKHNNMICYFYDEHGSITFVLKSVRTSVRNI